MRITFCGAAREVTGSLHLLEVEGRRIALDCGLFQGRRRVGDQKNRTFPFDPRTLHAVVLSHAHIDHIGRLPLLVKGGFSGTIHATPATRDLCAIMLADAAHIQEEDARYLSKKLKRNGEPPVPPLYDAKDVANTMPLFSSTALRRSFEVAPNLKAEYHEAGHMLGSAGVKLTWTPSGRAPVTLVFSGDIGRRGIPILHDPAPLPECDYLICESTYGGRRTQTNTDLKDSLLRIIRDTFGRGGKVIIPAFSVGRTQTLVYFIHQLVNKGKLRDVRVFVDSPLAVDATEIFKMHPDLYDVDAAAFNRETGDLLGVGCCTYVRSVEESKAIDQRSEPCVVISASGMCENGRILHHLKHTVAHSKNTVLIVGFQGEGTLGRRLVEKKPRVRIFGEEYPLNAAVEVLNGFSAHADCDELRAATRPLARRCKTAFLVHGEMDQMNAMAATMRAEGFARVEMPEAGRTVELA